MNKKIFYALSVAIILLIVFPLQAVLAQADPQYPFYTVQSGDTLSVIAARFRVSVDEIIDLNQIENPNVLAVGTQLKIPGYEGVSGELILHTVNLGESYSNLTEKNRFDFSLISRLNQLTSPDEIFVGSRLIMPNVDSEDQENLLAVLEQQQTVLDLSAEFQLNPWEIYFQTSTSGDRMILPGDYLFGSGNNLAQQQIAPGVVLLDINPLPFVQGKTVEVKLKTTAPMDLELEIGSFHPQFFEIGQNEYVALQGIGARQDTGILSMHLSGSRDGVKVLQIDQQILVESGYYGDDPPVSVDPITIQPDVVEPEQAFVEELLSKITQEKYWDGTFQYPVDDPCLSAYFGGSRIYNGTYHYYHTGIDFNVCKANNINIYASAPGVVVFAGPLTVRGNAVFIDHGWGVYTGYFHQSEILVSEGDFVQTGDLLGYIGNTGRSTGAHLHLEIWVNGVQVDPLDWLQTAYPN
jgi:murein DD-endopeptidase MepM/ murein hydrolase activator NlpD